MINCKSADGVDIVAMSTAYDVKCDVLELFYIDPTIIYIYCIAKMYGDVSSWMKWGLFWGDHLYNVLVYMQNYRRN